VVAFDERGRLLLVARSDDHTWGIPGGHMEVGEPIADAARREFVEETGYTVELVGVLGIYSDPVTQTHTYPDGNTMQFVGVVFEGRVGARVGQPDDEVTDVGWFGPGDLPPLFGPDAPVIADAFSDAPRPFVR
jgi:8-oxo-dGTP pyrophosphatase MutT (NUDIX family)